MGMLCAAHAGQNQGGVSHQMVGAPHLATIFTHGIKSEITFNVSGYPLTIILHSMVLSFPSSIRVCAGFLLQKKHG